MPLKKTEETMILRQYIVNMASHEPAGTPVPPERQLAEMFGLSRKTIGNVLDAMIENRYLVKRPRKGYFIRDTLETRYWKGEKIVGIILYNGTSACHGAEGMMFLTEIFRNALKYGFNTESITVTDRNRLPESLGHFHLDGLIWLAVPDNSIAVFEQLAEKIPTFGLFQGFKTPEKGNYIYLNHEKELRLKIDYLVERGMKKPLFIFPQQEQMCYRLDWLPAYLKERGIAFDPELLIREEEAEEKLPELFAQHTFDGIFARFQFLDISLNLAEQYKIRVPEELQVIGGYVRNQNITVARKPYEKMIAAATKTIWEQMNGSRDLLQSDHFKWEIIPGNTTRSKEKKR